MPTMVHCSPDRTLMTALLQRFDEEAGHVGLHVSWANTKIQNVGHGGAWPAICVGAIAVDWVNEFIYLYMSLAIPREKSLTFSMCANLLGGVATLSYPPYQIAPNSI